MYCKYCGQPIDDDSTFCRHCGKNVTVSGNKDINSPNNLITNLKESVLKNNIDKDVVIRKSKSIMNVIWKIIKTIWWIIVGIIAFFVVGFFMAPFIALFNAEFPDLGIFDQIEKIWKKDKTLIEESDSKIADDQQ